MTDPARRAPEALGPEERAAARALDVRTPQPATATYDVVVIGSGMSGLASAIILAKEGMRVLVLEQHYRPGGYLHRFFRKGGLSFDVGFHYLGGVEEDQVLGIYLGYLGLRDRVTFLPLDPEGYDQVVYPSVRFLIPAGRERYEQRLVEQFPHEREAIANYFDDMARICDGFGFYRVRSHADEGHAIKWLSEPLGRYLEERIGDPRLRRVLVGQNPLYGVEPRRTPVALHALVTDSFMLNPYAILGGGDALARAAVERIRELGGEVRTRRRVQEIRVDDERRVQGVTTERGQRFDAPLVISCAHPKVTVRLLPEKVLRRGYRTRVLGMEDGISTLSVFATTRADLSRHGSRNTYLYTIDELDEVYANRDRPHELAFVTVPSAREGTGKSGLHQVIGLGYMPWGRVAEWERTRTGDRGAAYEELKQAQAEELLALMTEAVPELRGTVETLEAATPLTNRDYAASEGGAAYGIHHSVEQSGLYGLRPRTRVSGLYLTGQSVLMPGVCGVTISAFHTCAHILGHDYLIGKVQRSHGHG